MGSLSASVSPSVVARMEQGAESLVVRARSGDQNAIAMIARIREEVPRSRRAALSFDLIARYVREHPIVEGVRLGAERASAAVTKERSLRAARDATRRGVSAEHYTKVVRCIERFPQRIDWLAVMAHVVADGRDVDEEVVCAVLPLLRGSVVLHKRRPVSLQRARRANVSIAGDWAAEFGDDGLTIVRGDGSPLAVDVGSEVVPADELFCRAFGEVSRPDRVVEMAAPIERNARQPIRVGYVLGLARAIQGVARHGRPISSLSETIAEELGG